MNRQERIGRIIAELRELTDALHKEIESGAFYKRGYLDRRRRIGRVKHLYGKLIGRLTWRETAVLVPAVAVLAMATGCEGDIFISDPFFDNLFKDPVKNAFSINLSSSGGYVAHAVHIVDLDGDGDLDIVDNRDVSFQKVYSFLENTGSPSNPAFADYATSFTSPPSPGFQNDFRPTTPTDGYYEYSINSAIGDIDGDGDPDIINIRSDYMYDFIGYSRNDGPATGFVNPMIDSGATTTIPGDWRMSAGDGMDIMNESVADIDGDGDLDLIGFTLKDPSYDVWQMSIIRNADTGSGPDFSSDAEDGVFGFVFYGNYDLRPVGPRFADFDGDGDLDMAFGSFNGSGIPSVFLSPNTGTPQEPKFTQILKNPFNILNASSDLAEQYVRMPVPVDIDDDGDFDVFVTEVKGSGTDDIWFHENTLID